MLKPTPLVQLTSFWWPFDRMNEKQYSIKRLFYSQYRSEILCLWSQLKMLISVGNLWILIICTLRVASLANVAEQIMQVTWVWYFLMCVARLPLLLKFLLQWTHLLFLLPSKSCMCNFFMWKLSLFSFLKKLEHRGHGTVFLGWYGNDWLLCDDWLVFNDW